MKSYYHLKYENPNDRTQNVLHVLNTNKSENMRQIFVLIEKSLFIVSASALFIMMILVSADVILRYFFHLPLTFQFEFTSYYLLVIATTLSLSRSEAQGAFIKLRLLTNILPLRFRGYLDALNSFIGSIIFLMIAWFSGINTIAQWQRGTTIFGVIDWPVWLSIIWVSIGCFALGIRLLIKTFNAIINPIIAVQNEPEQPEEY